MCRSFLKELFESNSLELGHPERSDHSTSPYYQNLTTARPLHSFEFVMSNPPDSPIPHPFPLDLSTSLPSLNQDASIHPLANVSEDAVGKVERGIRILSLDGGGMRGLFSLQVLRSLIQELYGAAGKSETQVLPASGGIAIDSKEFR